VPEFNDFLIQHPIVDASLTRGEGSELQGYAFQMRLILECHLSFSRARMFGRWKSDEPQRLSSF
jgi:hypothetical protein